MVVTAPIWGTVADRRGRKRMVLRSMWAAMITAFLMAFAMAPWQMVALRMIEGAFTGSVAACAALVASTAPKDRMGYALGMIQTAVFVGASIGPFLGGALADLIGYRATFMASSVLFAVGGFIVLFFVQENSSRSSAARNAAWPPSGLACLALHPHPDRHDLNPGALRFTQMGGRPILPLYIEELGGLPSPCCLTGRARLRANGTHQRHLLHDPRPPGRPGRAQQASSSPV